MLVHWGTLWGDVEAVALADSVHPVSDATEELAVRRVKIGLTQPQLARMIPCNVGTLNGWETGRHVPSAVYRNAWIAALENEERQLIDHLARYHPIARSGQTKFPT